MIFLAFVKREDDEDADTLAHTNWPALTFFLAITKKEKKNLMEGTLDSRDTSQ